MPSVPPHIARREARSRLAFLRHAEGGQSAADHYAGIHQRVRVSGRGAAVGAGDRRRREQGNPTALRSGDHAETHPTALMLN